MILNLRENWKKLNKMRIYTSFDLQGLTISFTDHFQALFCNLFMKSPQYLQYQASDLSWLLLCCLVTLNEG